MMMVEKDGRAGTTHGLVTVIERADGDAQKNLVVNIRSLIAMAYLIQDPMILKWWYVNNRVDLWMFAHFS